MKLKPCNYSASDLRSKLRSGVEIHCLEAPILGTAMLCIIILNFYLIFPMQFFY